MKLSLKTVVVMGSAVCALLVATGCSSTGKGYAKSDATASGMEKTAKEVDGIVAQTDATLLSLSNLTINPPADLRGPYKQFDGNVNKLQSMSKSVDAKGEDMRKRAADYLTTWSNQVSTIQSEEVRTISQQRRAEVEESFSKISTSFKKAKDAFDPFLSELRDIRTGLSLDLTPGGVKAVSDLSKKALGHGADLQAALSDAAKEIRALAAKMSSSAAASTPPPAK